MDFPHGKAAVEDLCLLRSVQLNGPDIIPRKPPGLPTTSLPCEDIPFKGIFCWLQWSAPCG